MIISRNYLTNVPDEEAEIFRLVGENEDGIGIFLENKDPLNYISYHVEGGNNSSIASFQSLQEENGNQGVDGILPPEGRALVVIRETKSFFRLMASSPGISAMEANIVVFTGTSSNTFTKGIL